VDQGNNIRRTGLIPPPRSRPKGTRDGRLIIFSVMASAFLIIVGLLTIVSVIGGQRVQTKLSYYVGVLDLYTHKHTCVNGEPLVVRETFYGGVFTIGMSCAAAALAMATVVTMSAQQYDVRQIVDNSNDLRLFDLDVELDFYGALSFSGGELCSPGTVRVTTNKITSVLDSEDFFTNPARNGSICRVKWSCHRCAFTSVQASINVQLASYDVDHAHRWDVSVHGFFWRVRSSNGVDHNNQTFGTTAAIEGHVLTPLGTVLKGPRPSQVFLQAVPTQVEDDFKHEDSTVALDFFNIEYATITVGDVVQAAQVPNNGGVSVDVVLAKQTPSKIQITALSDPLETVSLCASLVLGCFSLFAWFLRTFETLVQYGAKAFPFLVKFDPELVKRRLGHLDTHLDHPHSESHGHGHGCSEDWKGGNGQVPPALEVSADEHDEGNVHLVAPVSPVQPPSHVKSSPSLGEVAGQRFGTPTVAPSAAVTMSNGPTVPSHTVGSDEDEGEAVRVFC